MFRVPTRPYFHVTALVCGKQMEDRVDWQNLSDRGERGITGEMAAKMADRKKRRKMGCE
jgi:hypothetical protein